MIDLTTALNCIRVQKKYGTYQKRKIGIITGPIGMSYRPGEIVLFEKEFDSPSVDGTRRSTGTVTIEKPLTQPEIDSRRATGSLITTICTMIEVPAGYVEEVRVN